MAKIISGPFGIISGKVGNLVGYSLNGKQVFRSIPKKSNKPATDAQRAQRMRFGLVASFLSPLRSITSKGYGNPQSKKPQSGQCVAYHAQHAVKGTYPHLGIDYGKVVLATGWLAGVYSVEMSSNNEECIDFSWLNESTSSLQSPMGQVILVAYSPLNKKHEYLWAASNRASGCAMLEVPTSFSGDSVHCWIIFVSENGKKFSTSRYLGTVTVA